ncbi:hypothetical protein KR52_01535 [Synechococcus sp. KORDI-52]|nr:hypothetical protein KR52_01535 [Synechococcus sp. KORDI-52]
MKQGFYEAFGRGRCIKVWRAFGSDVSSDKFPDLSSHEFKGISAVVGHLRLSDFLKNSYAKREFDDGNVQILTSVRNPVERLVSEYNYVSCNVKHRLHDEIRGMSPMDYIKLQPANIQYDFLKPSDKSSIDDIVEIMKLFPIENSIKGFSNFFAEELKISLS